MGLLDSLDAVVEVDAPFTSVLPDVPTRDLLRARVHVRTRIVSCNDCALRTSGWVRQPVAFRGASPASMVVQGEAPSQHENRSGRAFDGPAGDAMAAVLAEAGIDPTTVMYVNTVSCFPHGQLSDGHVHACRGNLKAQIELGHTHWVLLVGNVALRSHRADLTVTTMQGTTFQKNGLVFMPIVHPLKERSAWREVVDQLVRWREVVTGERMVSDLYGVLCAQLGCDGWVRHYDPEGVAWCGRHWETRVMTETEMKVQKERELDDAVKRAMQRTFAKRQGRLDG